MSALGSTLSSRAPYGVKPRMCQRVLGAEFTETCRITHKRTEDCDGSHLRFVRSCNASIEMTSEFFHLSWTRWLPLEVLTRMNKRTFVFAALSLGATATLGI